MNEKVGVFVPRMQRVQCRALTCLHNMLAVMDMECLGGAAGLQAVAQHLSSLIFTSAGEREKKEKEKKESLLDLIFDLSFILH